MYFVTDNIEFNDLIGHSDHVVLKFNFAFMNNIDYYTNPKFCYENHLTSNNFLIINNVGL